MQYGGQANNDYNKGYEDAQSLWFPYALGYWQGRACGQFENGTYENMSDEKQNAYKLGYEAGVSDYSELDAN